MTEEPPRKQRNLPLLLAAWASPAMPLLIVLLAIAADYVQYRLRLQGTIITDEESRKLSNNLMLWIAMPCSGLGLLFAIIGLCGLKTNGPAATLPGVILGLLLNGVCCLGATVSWLLRDVRFL